MRRLFLALPLSREGARNIWEAWEAIRFSGSRIRWVVPEQFHITLVFLGDTPEQDIPVILECMEKTARGFSAFPVLTGGPGAFFGKKGPRVLFESLKEGGDSVREIQKVLIRCLTPHFSLERRRFHPHITTARIKSGSELAGGFISDGGNVSVRDTLQRMILFESILSPRGAEYFPIYETPLNRE